jgi:hypothetical protein
MGQPGRAASVALLALAPAAWLAADTPLLPLDYDPKQPMLRFFKRGRLLASVSLDELVPDASKLARTASHYAWGHYLGFDEQGRYGVELLDGARVRFDPETGRRLPGSH